MVTVNVQGHGAFVIHSSKLNELLDWLKLNSMPVESNVRPLRDEGDTLLNG
jgi:hypothetical protein